MCELRNIITMANQNSLILGDELCSGTEKRKTSIFIRLDLKYLSKKKFLLFLATHFHEIILRKTKLLKDK